MMVALPRRRPRNYKPCALTSVMTTVQDIESKSHAGLEAVLSSCAFVGFADPVFVLLQHQTRLYLCNVRVLCEELLRQQVFMRFSNFDRIALQEPVPLRAMLEQASRLVREKHAQAYVDEGGRVAPPWTADACMEALMRMREMLAEYFCIEITADARVAALPCLVDGHAPDLAFLPLFFYFLAAEVNWQLENECFHGIARQLARFYVPRPPLLEEPQQDQQEQQDAVKAYEACMQYTMLPSIKTLLYPPRSFSNDGTFVQIATLETLYKVFERC